MEYPDYLEHHGILGQKWGVRRYQNSDGTWTKQGLVRRKSRVYINEDGSLTKQGLEKYSNSDNMHDLILRKHQKAVKDYNNGKISKKALKQLNISDAEYDFLDSRQTVLNKEYGGAKIGSVVGALTLGSAYTASCLSSMGTVPISGLPIISGMGGIHGLAIGTIIGSGLATKDIDTMRDKEEAFINSLPKKMQAKYLEDVFDYDKSMQEQHFMDEMQRQAHQTAVNQHQIAVDQHLQAVNMHAQMPYM